MTTVLIHNSFDVGPTPVIYCGNVNGQRDVDYLMDRVTSPCGVCFFWLTRDQDRATNASWSTTEMKAAARRSWTGSSRRRFRRLWSWRRCWGPCSRRARTWQRTRRAPDAAVIRLLARRHSAKRREVLFLAIAGVRARVALPRQPEGGPWRACAQRRDRSALTGWRRLPASGVMSHDEACKTVLLAWIGRFTASNSN